MKMGRTIDVVGSMAVLAFAAGCTHETSVEEEQQREADLAFGLLAEVDLGEGHTVKFMEPSQGSIAIVEKFRIGHKRELDVTQGIHALWRQIAPDSLMPTALLSLADAEQLQLERRAALGPVQDPEAAEGGELLPGEYEPEGEPASALVEKHQTSNPVHWEVDQRGCNTLRRSIKWSWCWENRTGGFTEAARSGEAIASAISVYEGHGLTFCHRMGSDNYCQDLDVGQGGTFIGKVGTNFFGVHVDQVLQSRIPIIVVGTNWHWGGSISGDWDTIHTFGGYAMHL